jgi:hypothetical protein
MLVVSSQHHYVSACKAVPGRWDFKRDMQVSAQLPASDAREDTPVWFQTNPRQPDLRDR